MVANPLHRAMSRDRRRQSRHREICFAQRCDVAKFLFLAGRVDGRLDHQGSGEHKKIMPGQRLMFQASNLVCAQNAILESEYFE